MLPLLPPGARTGRRYSRSGGGLSIQGREHSSKGSASLSSSDTRRAARRLFLQSVPEARTEADMQALDDAVLYGSEACRYLTKGARLALACHAQLATFENGDSVCLPGQEVSRVFFVLHGLVSTVAVGEQGSSFW